MNSVRKVKNVWLQDASVDEAIGTVSEEPLLSTGPNRTSSERGRARGCAAVDDDITKNVELVFYDS